MVCFSKSLNFQCLYIFAGGECPCFAFGLSILNFLVVFALLDCLCHFFFLFFSVVFVPLFLCFHL